MINLSSLGIDQELMRGDLSWLDLQDRHAAAADLDFWSILLASASSAGQTPPQSQHAPRVSAAAGAPAISSTPALDVVVDGSSARGRPAPALPFIEASVFGHAAFQVATSRAAVTLRRIAIPRLEELALATEIRAPTLNAPPAHAPAARAARETAPLASERPSRWTVQTHKFDATVVVTIKFDAQSTDAAEASAPRMLQAPVRRRHILAESKTNVALVAVQATEHGLRVFARVGRMEPTERAALRHAALAVLAEHGWTNGDIVLSEPARTTRTKEELTWPKSRR